MILSRSSRKLSLCSRRGAAHSTRDVCLKIWTRSRSQRLRRLKLKHFIDCVNNHGTTKARSLEQVRLSFVDGWLLLTFCTNEEFFQSFTAIIKLCKAYYMLRIALTGDIRGPSEATHRGCESSSGNTRLNLSIPVVIRKNHVLSFGRASRCGQQFNETCLLVSLECIIRARQPRHQEHRAGWNWAVPYLVLGAGVASVPIAHAILVQIMRLITSSASPASPAPSYFVWYQLPHQQVHHFHRHFNRSR